MGLGRPSLPTMAAVSGHLADEHSTPPRFQRAVESLRAAAVRSEVELTPVRAPQRLAPYAYAVTGSVAVGGDELADGRFVVLHDPDGHEAWQGTFRLVTLVSAELEPEMAADPLLAEVGWSWLLGALDARGAGFHAPSGTVSRSSSHYFGGLAERPVSTTVEIRASWTPDEAGAGPDLPAHLAAWCDLLCTSGGLPPEEPGARDEDLGGAGCGVVPLPNRAGPRS
jgi:Protein of unknown function (DUF3000)